MDKYDKTDTYERAKKTHCRQELTHQQVARINLPRGHYDGQCFRPLNRKGQKALYNLLSEIVEQMIVDGQIHYVIDDESNGAEETVIVTATILDTDTYYPDQNTQEIYGALYYLWDRRMISGSGLSEYFDPAPELSTPQILPWDENS